MNKRARPLFLHLWNFFLASQTVELGCMFWSIVMHKDHGLTECCRHFLYHCLKKVSSKNWQCIWEFIFSPCATRKGQTSSSLITAAHIVMPPSPCCRLTWTCALGPLVSQPQAQLSGPSRVTLISSVHKTLKNQSLCIYWLNVDA